MQKFTLNKQLAADTHALFIYQDFHVLLHKNATIPWFILVPETDVIETYELNNEQRNTQHLLCQTVGAFLYSDHQSEKVNIAAIGNIVQQLHIHIVGRNAQDPCWPGVVWGASYQQQEYSTDQCHQIRDRLLSMLN